MHRSPQENFDFDEWMALYRSDPAGFEARRQTVLMLELARGDERQRHAGREALARYESAAEALCSNDRVALSAALMHESLAELANRLDGLRTASGGAGASEQG